MVGSGTLAEERTATLVAQGPVVVDTTGSRAKLKPVPISAVTLKDQFWAPRMRVNHEVTIPDQLRLLEETGRIDNLRRVSGQVDKPFEGKYFNDSDVYKWLEAASWALASRDDPDLDRAMDEVIAVIAAAQRPDGYLNSYFALERADQRWTIPDLHETYCAGHLFQAAVAHYRATGKTNLLDVATRFADHICDRFGPEEEGKRFWIDGHEEVEMALIELGRATGNERYLDQAEYFINARGYKRLPKPYDGRFDYNYHQDHEPIREASAVTGHAVRQLYYLSGATDLLTERDDPALAAALDRLWHNMVERRMYLTGGLGSRWEGEAFGEDYELPNFRAYTETCAAIASVMWNWRLLLLTGDAKYGDLAEHTLFNAVLPGLSLDGRTYFYQNPLTDDGHHRRQPWFGVACCPPNLARTLAALPGYVYAVSDDTIYAQLYATHDATVTLADGRSVSLRQETNYPWDGDVTIEVGTPGDFALAFRIPGWVAGQPKVEINGAPWDGNVTPGTFAEVRREWSAGDTVRLVLPMEARRFVAHPHVEEDTGRVAIVRGPIVYCLEAADHDATDIRDLSLPDDAPLTAAWNPEKLGGIVEVTAPASASDPTDRWAGKLYQPLDSADGQAAASDVTLTAIPYFAWANREPGRMQVWIRRGRPA